ncbi:butyrate kinase [bacterium]|nr:butyrate kinase [bacterium]
MDKKYRVLVVNPGSTSDEIALFDGDDEIFHFVSRYSPADLAPYDGKKVTAQYEFRKELVEQKLRDNGIAPSSLDAVIGRGGLIKPVPSGTFVVNDALLNDLREGVLGDHPSNLGGIIARAIAEPLGIPAYIADPVVVDEMEPLARYSGMPENPRISIFHALNQKRVARLAAKELGRKYEELNLIVFHGGGGITVGCHKHGRVIDVNNGLDGDGPFTPQRSGGVPSGGLARLCFSGKYSYRDIKLMIKGRGGLVAYTGTSDIVLLKRYIKGEDLSDEERSHLKKDLTRDKAREVLEALAYFVAKEIASLAAVLRGKVDAIVLSGGISYDSEFIVPWIRERVEWIAPVLVYPGGDEMRALRDAAIRALSGEEKPHIYE